MKNLKNIKYNKKTTLNNFFEKNLHNFNSNFINQMKKKERQKEKRPIEKEKEKLSETLGC